MTGKELIQIIQERKLEDYEFQFADYFDGWTDMYTIEEYNIDYGTNNKKKTVVINTFN